MKKIKLFKPHINRYAIWNAVKVLMSGQLAEGPQVKALEKALGEKFHLNDVITLNSGTAALELAYELAEIGPGDEVITPVLTAVMTNIPLARRKAKIIFADAEEDLNVDIDDVKRKITSKTKAIVFVHFNGNNRGFDEIVKLCEERKITLIEDAAQAIGSPNWGKGDFVCMSFQAIKTFTTGDGGAIVCKDHELSAKARRLRWFGLDRARRDTYLITELGYKYHMNDIAAAIGLGNLRDLDIVVGYRNRLVDEYRKQGISAFTWRAFALVDRRDELQKKLKEQGIDSAVYDNRNDVHPIFGGKQNLVKMDTIESRYLLLPLHMGVTVEDVQKIGAIVKKHNEI